MVNTVMSNLQMAEELLLKFGCDDVKATEKIKSCHDFI